MHPSSLENMLKCVNRYVSGTELEEQSIVEVIDVGGADVNGSYRPLFFDKRYRYRTADVDASLGVDIVLTDPYSIPIGDSSVDIVVSGQAFEHIEFFWQTFSEMVRVLKRDGFIFLIAPSSGPEHRYPVDCYRFYPDAFAALAKFAKCELIEVWRDERGPWHDLVGVFRHSGARPFTRKVAAAQLSPEDAWNGVPGSEQEEVTRGRAPYRDALSRIHKRLQPKHYLEIGVRHGHSLSLATGDAVGVDPRPELKVELPASTKIVACDSDTFFETRPLDPPPDFAFIDGMHRFEFVLRDFMNIERAAVPGSAVVIDDVFPNHQAQAERERRTRVWTGDVWKFVEIIRTHRPDLYLATIDTSPTGLAVIAGLDPNNRVLWDKYNPIVRRFLGANDVPQHVLERRDALDPEGPDFSSLLDSLGEAYRRRRGPRGVIQRLQAPAPDSAQAPKLSVVVIAFNMARELPRTIRSLSPDFQRDVASSDYEIIVVDNGSAVPVDEGELRKLADNVRVYRMKDATASPVPAVQFGLEAARADLVGVFIDGARMASPGLLANALAASRLHERPVIGTVAFHLGSKVQMQSVHEGYDQAAEDALLNSSAWEEDGYRLFDISVFAGSSAGGWFVVPAESNAVFMRGAHWRDLGGYDSRFVSPGGGLVNLDLWARACADPDARLIMLLGEATFHQVHGGIATNRESDLPMKTFKEEYERIHGHSYKRPAREPYFFGTLPKSLQSR